MKIKSENVKSETDLVSYGIGFMTGLIIGIVFTLFELYKYGVIR